VLLGWSAQIWTNWRVMIRAGDGVDDVIITAHGSRWRHHVTLVVPSC
jgi:hypothetical protein